MWGVARAVNTEQRFGNWLYLTLWVLVTTFVSLLVVGISPSLPVATVKATFLVLIVVLLIVPELRLSFSDSKTGGVERKFITIPTYAEIAKKINRSGSILDIGCSEGFFLGDIETSGLKVGIDMDFDRLRIGRQERPNVNFVNADATHLPFVETSFQTVVFIGVLPYIEKPSAALNEVHRVLTNFGQVEISTANANWINRYLNIYNWKYRFQFYSLEDLEKVLKESGFRVKSLYSRGRIIAPLVGNLFIILNFVDRIHGNTGSIIGPWGLWMRKILNPVIQWEYDHHRGDGYQNFASGFRND
jgi:2-polyprenyl-3-methyl-5-hydroxy-6-metoxy-1,4-benzoquinol methylase